MTDREEEKFDLAWYCTMLNLAVSDQGNLAGPYVVKMQSRLVRVFSIEMSILPLLTPWRAVGVDAPPCFTGKGRVSGRHRDYKLEVGSKQLA